MWRVVEFGPFLMTCVVAITTLTFTGIMVNLILNFPNVGCHGDGLWQFSLTLLNSLSLLTTYILDVKTVTLLKS